MITRNMKYFSLIPLLIFIFAVPICCTEQQNNPQAIDVKATIDGSASFQRLDGIGVNVNTRSWNGRELEPALDLFIDSLQINLWRVIVETVEKWEEQNDNNDPFVFNWDYYNKLYETPKFQRVWDMMAYLNKRGVTGNLMINFMGIIPLWMGGEIVKPEYEDEYIEMLVSFFYYAKNTRHLQFGLISPMNEPDIRKEGPTVGPEQYARLLKKFISRMNDVGLNGIQYAGPDVASMHTGIQKYLPEMIKEPVIMSNLAFWALHSYEGYYANADSAIKHSAYPQAKWQVTEWNEWCNGCDDGKLGNYNYDYAASSLTRLLDLLSNGANGAILWEGYDSYYEHHAPSPFSYWGVLEYNAESKTYHPRKHFYTLSQFTRFISPGSVRIGVNASAKELMITAFRDERGQLAIIGLNPHDQDIVIDGSLKDIPGVKRLQYYYTNSAENLQRGADIKAGKGFKAAIPANTIFTLKSY